MTMTLGDLQQLLDQAGFKYFLAPDPPAILAPFGGVFGSYQIVMRVEVDGRFLQCRTLGYLTCPSGHGSLPQVLRTIAEINFGRRVLKLGWDPNDGEIMGYADLWMEDGQVTSSQLRAMLGIFIAGLDIAYKRVGETIQTGRDPGDVLPDAVPSAPPPTKVPTL